MSPNGPRISVVIPTYNRGQLLVNAIESVLAQTYKDLEIIIVDDGSTDDTAELLKPYKEHIRYFYHQNKGASASQNKGIEVSRGKWISVLASDDLWCPNKLRSQLNTLERFVGRSRACFTDCSFFGDPAVNVTAFQQAGFIPDAPIGILPNAQEHVLHRYPIIYVQSLLIERALIEGIGGFDNAMMVCEDTDLIFRLSLATEFCYIAEPLVKIDRTPQRAVGLSEIFLERSDRAFTYRDYMLRKWLALPQKIDEATKHLTQQHLESLHYDWLVRRLHQGRLGGVASNIKQLRSCGVTYSDLVVTLFTRAARNFFLRPQEG